MKEFESQKHESYGMISISRYQGGGDQTFFGSSIKQEGGLEITIKEGEVQRGLNRDWFHGSKLILRCRLSPSQFAEAITTMNSGEGTPITLLYADGREREKPPFTNKRLQFEAEFEESIREVTETVMSVTKSATEILSRQKPATKKEKELILDSLEYLKQEIAQNMPFVQKSFNEQMDKTVKEAKNEIETYVNSTIHSLGMEKMSELKQLAEKNK